MISRERLSWWNLAVFWFLVAGFLGCVMRYAFVKELPFDIAYKNIQHAHSHVAMMGWLYSALYVLIVALFQLNRKVYRPLFWWTQFSVLGMLVFFPLQGYGPLSIVFSTLHIFLSYYFVWQVVKDLRASKQELMLSKVLLYTALFFLFLSTLGTWGLGVIMNTSLRGSAWYYGAIQFFLHFQFNGWFVFAALALFFRFAEERGISIALSQAKMFYWTLVVSCLLSFALAVSWSTPDLYLFLINSVGVVIQILALYYLFHLVQPLIAGNKMGVQLWNRNLLVFAFLCLSLKIGLQSLVAFPELAKASYLIRNFVIGFIHLLMLGSISTFAMGMMGELGLQWTKLGRWGYYLFVVGFLGTESLLFLQGLMLWQEFGFLPSYYMWIFIGSVILWLGIIAYFMDTIRVLKRS